MSRAKTKGAVLTCALIAATVAVALFLTAEAWAFVPAVAIMLVIQLASPIDDRPDIPNNPAKAWLFGAAAIVGVYLIVRGLAADAIFIAVGALLLCLSLLALWMIRQGRNPWWMRGWADYSKRH